MYPRAFVCSQEHSEQGRRFAMAPPEDAVAIEADPAKDEKKDEKKDKSKDVKDDDALSAEDEALKEGLELAVERLKDPDEGVQKMRAALTHLTTEIRSATSSMTSVPKPLKFLRQHYGDLKTTHAGLPAGENKTILADILAVLAMTMAKIGTRELLTFKLAGTRGDLGSWGHEFVRSLAGEIGQEYQARVVKASEDPASVADTGDLLALVDDIVPFHIQHNAEAEAIDLLIEVQQLKKLTARDDDRPEQLRARVPVPAALRRLHVRPRRPARDACGCVRGVQGPGAVPGRDARRDPLRRHVAHRRGAQPVHGRDDEEAALPAARAPPRQLRLLGGRGDERADREQQPARNFLSARPRPRRARAQDARGHLQVAPLRDGRLPPRPRREPAGRLGALEPRVDLRQRVRERGLRQGHAARDARGQRVAVQEQGARHAERGGVARHASCSGTSRRASRRSTSSCTAPRTTSRRAPCSRSASSAAACATSPTRRSRCCPSTSRAVAPVHPQAAALVALGIAYAGSAREDVMEYLTPIVSNTENANITEVALAALSLGQVFVGTCNEDVGSVLVQRLMESSDAELDDSVSRFLCLGLGLLFLGKMEKVDAIIEAVKTVEHKMGQYAALTLETCAYAGTGNVLKVQRMLHVCAEHLTENAEHQSVAVIGIALVTAGEDVGSEMALRAFEHLLHYGELPVRRGARAPRSRCSACPTPTTPSSTSSRGCRTTRTPRSRSAPSSASAS